MMGENDHVPTSDAMSDMTSVLLTSKYSTSWWATSSASAIDEQETRETEKEASLFAGFATNAATQAGNRSKIGSMAMVRVAQHSASERCVGDFPSKGILVIYWVILRASMPALPLRP